MTRYNIIKGVLVGAFSIVAACLIAPLIDWIMRNFTKKQVEINIIPIYPKNEFSEEIE